MPTCFDSKHVYLFTYRSLSMLFYPSSVAAKLAAILIQQWKMVSVVKLKLLCNYILYSLAEKWVWLQLIRRMQT